MFLTCAYDLGTDFPPKSTPNVQLVFARPHYRGHMLVGTQGGLIHVVRAAWS